MRKLKIGVLGCANIAQRLVIPAIIDTPEYELVAVASRNEEKAQQYANQFQCDALVGYETMINRDDITAVYVPLPIGLHKEWVIKCLESGKHVLSEKSLATDYTSTELMVSAARENSKVLIENFMFQYHSQHQYIFDLIESGEIGAIRCFRSSFGFPPFNSDTNIRYKKELGGGALLDAGAYTIKATQLFLGNDLELRGSYLKQHDSYDVDFFGGAFLVNSKGVFAELAWGFDNFYQCNYEFWGSKGKVIAERAFTASPGFKPKVILEKQDEKQEIFLPADNHFVKILQYFYKSVMINNLENNYTELLNQARLLESVKIHANYKQ